MALVEVKVPDIGDFDEVAVIELMVKVGDTIKAEQSLITVESDKAAMEIPSSTAGVVKELRVKLGDKVKQGSVVLVLEASGAVSVPAEVPAAAPAVAPAVQSVPVAAPATDAAVPMTSSIVAAAPAPAPAPAHAHAHAHAHNPGAPTLGLPHASPSVRKFARELGVPLEEVKGNGPKGRISQDDVQAFTKDVMAGAMQTKAQAAKAPAGGDGAALGLIPWPKVDFAKFGPIERKEMGRIKKISGANLLRNAIMIPAVTNHDDADITELEAFRVSTNKENEKSGVKVTMLAFLIKACVAALKKIPRVQQLFGW